MHGVRRGSILNAAFAAGRAEQGSSAGLAVTAVAPPGTSGGWIPDGQKWPGVTEDLGSLRLCMRQRAVTGGGTDRSKRSEMHAAPPLARACTEARPFRSEGSAAACEARISTCLRGARKMVRNAGPCNLPYSTRVQVGAMFRTRRLRIQEHPIQEKVDICLYKEIRSSERHGRRR